MPQFRDGQYYGQFVVEPGPAAAQYVLVGDANGHFGAGGNVPTVTTAAGNGTATTTPLILAGSSDAAGQITFGSGTGPGTGNQIVIAFNQPYNQAITGRVPIVMIAAINQATALLNPFVVAATTNFAVGVGSTATASQGSGVYGINWWVVG